MAEFKVFGEQDNKSETTGTKKGGKLKRLFKKKPFLIAVAVVVVLGLIALVRKSQQPVQTADESNMVVADGLEVMYPSTDTYMTSEGDYITDVLDSLGMVLGEMQTEHENEMISIQESFSEEVSSLKNTFDVTVDSMSMQIEDLSDKVDTQSDTITEQAQTIARQNDIQAMQNNSDAWFYASDSERKALEQSNAQIAAKYGWERGDDGAWYDGGVKVYETTTQQVVTSSAPATKTLSSGSTGSSGSTSSKSSSGSSTASDIATMKANSAAWHTASDTQKQQLHEQNKQIAAKNGWSYDAASGTYSDKSGNRVY